ncbi:hypothetical protein Tco_1137163 [Tanacetum coccineum]
MACHVADPDPNRSRPGPRTDPTWPMTQSKPGPRPDPDLAHFPQDLAVDWWSTTVDRWFGDGPTMVKRWYTRYCSKYEVDWYEEGSEGTHVMHLLVDLKYSSLVAAVSPRSIYEAVG